MHQKTIRVHKRDSAFVYAILESLEGMASYSTLDSPLGADYRDLSLHIPEGFHDELDIVLNGLRKKMPIIEP